MKPTYNATQDNVLDTKRIFLSSECANDEEIFNHISHVLSEYHISKDNLLEFDFKLAFTGDYLIRYVDGKVELSKIIIQKNDLTIERMGTF